MKEEIDKEMDKITVADKKYFKKEKKKSAVSLEQRNPS